MAKKILTISLIIVAIYFVFADNLRFGTEAAEPTHAQPGPGTFNLQIQAVEVTQGIRGDIPARIVPDGALSLPNDGAVHVANRRTVVRVYPWVQDKTKSTLPAITAQLSAYRDGALLSGSPIFPQNRVLENISPDWDLDQMRADAGKSWNFLLPSAWTASEDGDDAFTLRFVVEVNPPGLDHQAECQECRVDNQVILEDQRFVTVPTLTIQPYLVTHTVTDLKNHQVTYIGPSQAEFQAVLKSAQSMLPVGDPGRGLAVLPAIEIEWQGRLHDGEQHVFPQAMIQQYLPNGKLEKKSDNIIHVFIFTANTNHDFLVYNNSGGKWLGLAWTGKPYVQCAARGRDLVHELTHAFGLSHAGDQHGETTTNPEYPDRFGRVEPEAYGFDIWEMRAVPPVRNGVGTQDYMSYNLTDPFWVSIYTWEAVAALLGQPNLDV